jgi:glycosyltransferase involved in cell wall biosynthesis
MTEENNEKQNGEFKINIPIDELRKKKLFVATPMYGGQCAGMYARSMLDLSAKCASYGIPLQVYYLFNESLITRARNYIVDEFMRSGATHLMFIDSDIGFNPEDVIALLAMQSDDSPYDVIGGPYPKKTIAWEKIKQAVDKGVADEDPSVLEKFVGDYVFNPKVNTGSIPLNRPVEVMEIGTGFMMIRRKTFEDYAKAYPDLFYKPDHVRTEHFDGSREIQAVFDTIIDPVSKRYLSEDYMFCYNVAKMGASVWFCPWMRTQHVGSMVFGGSLIDLASIGASATADISKLNKKKK